MVQLKTRLPFSSPDKLTFWRYKGFPRTTTQVLNLRWDFTDLDTGTFFLLASSTGMSECGESLERAGLWWVQTCSIPNETTRSEHLAYAV